MVLDRTVHRRARTAARMDWAQRVERALESDAAELVLAARFLYVGERTRLTG